MCNSTNKIELVKALRNGIGIQHLLNEAYKILGNPLYIHDRDDKLLAYTDNVITDDPIWNEIVAYNSVSSETLELLINERFGEAVANAKRIAFLTSDKLKYDRILGKLFNSDNTRMASVDVIACKKPFEDEDPMVFEEFCKILSQELSKNELYQNYGKIYQENIIRQLIDGSIIDRPYYSGRIEDIYKGLKVYLYLAVADISECDPKHAKLRYFTDLFKHIQPEFEYSIYSDYIVIIMSSDNTSLNVKEDLNKLYRLFERNNIYVGISSHFENLFELHKHYIEAVHALNTVLKNTNS